LPAGVRIPSLSLLILSTEGKAHGCGMGWQQACQAFARSCSSTSGLVAECIVAIDVTRARFRLMQMHFVMHMCLLADMML
ncbi:MAG: hypothetical protein AAFR83_25825, partial [Cyanobacteria bacterium J06629_18]